MLKKEKKLNNVKFLFIAREGKKRLEDKKGNTEQGQ